MDVAFLLYIIELNSVIYNRSIEIYSFARKGERGGGGNFVDNLSLTIWEFKLIFYKTQNRFQDLRKK